MTTYNHKIEVFNGTDTDTFHPETNTGQVYDFTNNAWLNSIIGTLGDLTTTQKSSLVQSINELAGTKADNSTVNNHTSFIATTSQLGHVRPDGTTITIDNSGVISAVGGSGGSGTVTSVNGITPTPTGEVIISANEIDVILLEEGTETGIVESEVAMLIRGGYYDSSSGVYSTNDNGQWRSTELIENNGANTYKLNYSYDSTVANFRALGWNGTTYLGSLTVAVNSEFTVNANITRFALNLPLPNPVPNTNPPLEPSFPNIDALMGVNLVRLEEGIVEEEVVVNLNNVINDMWGEITDLKGESPRLPTLKVLMIGNSFSQDVINHAHLIANSAGVNVIFGNLYRVNESLQGHWTQINTNATSYIYVENSSINGVTDSTITYDNSFLNILRKETWDVITYQQYSPDSGIYSTFQPYLQNIIDFVNTNKTNPNLKHGLHMTWAYPTSSTVAGFANYSNNQMTMYKAILNAYQQAMNASDIDILIPTGTAIQYARSIPQLQALDLDLGSDGSHLGDMGDYIGGLLIFNTLMTHKYKKSLLDDVTYTVNSKYLSYLAKVAVENASLNPFNYDLIKEESVTNYGGKFEWRFNPTTNSLDLVVLD